MTGFGGTWKTKAHLTICHKMTYGLAMLRSILKMAAMAVREVALNFSTHWNVSHFLLTFSMFELLRPISIFDGPDRTWTEGSADDWRGFSLISHFSVEKVESLYYFRAKINKRLWLDLDSWSESQQNSVPNSWDNWTGIISTSESK